MEISGSSDREVDQVEWIEDLSAKTLVALIERLEQSESMEQLIFRETEMDDAYRQADADVRLAERASDGQTLAQSLRIRDIVLRAHDLVGLQAIPEAIQELTQALAIRIGLDSGAR